MLNTIPYELYMAKGTLMHDANIVDIGSGKTTFLDLLAGRRRGDTYQV